MAPPIRVQGTDCVFPLIDISISAAVGGDSLENTLPRRSSLALEPHACFRRREKPVFPVPFAPYITARFVLPNARDAPVLIALTPDTQKILLIRSSGRWAA